MAQAFFFSSRRRHTRFDCDWSSDVCSSDLADYYHEALNRWINASDPDHPSEKRKFTVKYHPRRRREVWFLDPEVKQYVKLDRYPFQADRKSTRLNSSHSQISYAVFCLKKKK